jgi:hypothetical protein
VSGFVEGIYVARGAGTPVERVGEVAALEGCGLAGDRYCEGTGHWCRFGRACQVTLIAAEDLDAIEKEADIRVRDGEHRRNVVLRSVNLEDLRWRAVPDRRGDPRVRRATLGLPVQGEVDRAWNDTGAQRTRRHLCQGRRERSYPRPRRGRRDLLIRISRRKT